MAFDNSEFNARLAEFAMGKTKTPLNYSQMNAVGSILADSHTPRNAAKNANPVKLIHGPPGTGKTATIVNSKKLIPFKLVWLTFFINSYCGLNFTFPCFNVCSDQCSHPGGCEKSFYPC